jgi:hypothetical protein
VDGLLGSGSPLTVLLSAGKHEVTLMATDADGQSTRGTVSVDVFADLDQDGLADEYEQDHPGLDWWNPDGTADLDGDGLSNRGEAEWAIDPSHPDSDGDGVPDGDEVAGGSLPDVSTSAPPTSTVWRRAGHGRWSRRRRRARRRSAAASGARCASGG